MSAFLHRRSVILILKTARWAAAALLVAVSLSAAGCAERPASSPAPAPAESEPVATTRSAADASPRASDGVIMAVREVGPVIGDPATGPYRTSIRGEFGISDCLFMNQDGDPMSPMLASEWAIAPDGSSVSIRLRAGIPFNAPPAAPSADYGDLSADDVVWTLNRHNLNVNPSSSAFNATQFAAFFGEAKAAGERELEIPLATPVFFGLPLTEMGIQRTLPAIESRRAFEIIGADEIQGVSVGTGPFVQGEWIPGERGEVEALPDNWLRSARIETFAVVQARDPDARIAMLSSGAADAAEMDASQADRIRSAGMAFIPTMQPNDTVTLSVVFAGNLWEEVHARTGEPLMAWNSPAYERDYPWIGDPWGGKSPYQDTDNPPGVSDMEQARLVRWALSLALDRERVVAEIQSGLGAPLYSEYIGPLYPGWDAERTVSKADMDAILERRACRECPTYAVAAPTTDGRRWAWRVPFDRADAERLLDAAGYPRGEDGVRFDIKIVKDVCETGETCLDHASAIADAWDAIGVRTTLLRESMFPIVAARMAAREQFYPLAINCVVETANTPLDWPYPPHDTSLTRPGWGCGFESQFLAKMQLKTTAEPSRREREAQHLDVADWMQYWQLFNGVSQLPKAIAANPSRIESWSARSSMIPTWHRPEFIIPAERR